MGSKRINLVSGNPVVTLILQRNVLYCTAAQPTEQIIVIIILTMNTASLWHPSFDRMTAISTVNLDIRCWYQSLLLGRCTVHCWPREAMKAWWQGILLLFQTKMIWRLKVGIRCLLYTETKARMEPEKTIRPFVGNIIIMQCRLHYCPKYSSIRRPESQKWP